RDIDAMSRGKSTFAGWEKCFYPCSIASSLRACPTRRSAELGAEPCARPPGGLAAHRTGTGGGADPAGAPSGCRCTSGPGAAASLDRKSTRLNSSHVKISYAVFCLKKKLIELLVVVAIISILA